jgi:hypothetical protein
MGFQADLIWFDEDISKENWIGEMQARLADRKGRFFWSAMPWNKNDGLLGLKERAEKAAEEGNLNNIQMFVLRFLDNPHIDDEEKAKNLERWGAIGIDEVRMRAEGDFAIESALMYPTFHTPIRFLPRSSFQHGLLPEGWTRYVAIDPGHAVMATLFAAVPPDESMLLFYDELYIRNCNARIWAEEFVRKAGHHPIHAAILDMHGGMLRDLGSGRLPHELYSEELKKRKFSFLTRGNSFIPGTDDVSARSEIVRQMLHTKPDGTTYIKVLEGTCENLVREMKRYRKKVTMLGGTPYITDAPQTRGEIHAAQCMEYLCAFEPKYHKPPRATGPDPWWVSWLKRRDKKRREETGNFVNLGPSRSSK